MGKPASAVDRTVVRPLLRWAGSKRALVQQLRQLVPPDCSRYIEPFAGSACLFFAMAPDDAVLGDNNRELMNFYEQLRTNPDAIADRLHALPRDHATYYSMRDRKPRDLERLDQAVRFFYLNRLAFNGVYRTNRQGEFNVPIGTNVGEFPSPAEILKAADLLRKTDLIAGDFETTLNLVESGDFVYLDPPYSRSKSADYGVYGYGSFDFSEFERLVVSLNRIDASGATFLVSYVDSPHVISALAEFSIDYLDVATQVGGTVRSRTRRRELLVSNRPQIFDELGTN